MNYRHAFHAGNFADCFKHALLVALLDSLVIKPAPFFVLDTHAGAGFYNLDADQARLTAEADSGVRRLLRSPAPALARYLELMEQLGLYPGSPALIRAVLRERDRLACCELHSEDAAALRQLFRRDPRIAVHNRSGWEAMRALLPPKERRGLVFIDPPFEAPDEFIRLMDGLQQGHQRFGHGVFAVWYPIKHVASIRAFHANLTTSGIRDIVVVELRLRDITRPDRLNGCGLVVINSPYQFEDQAGLIASAVLDGLGDNESGGGAAVIRLVDE